MGSLVKNELGNYYLTEKGREALLTLQPMEKYNENARLREQVGLLIRALRTDIDSIREVVIAQLSMLGPKAVPFLTSALHQAIIEKEKSEKNDTLRSYDYDSNDATEASERAITGLVTALGITSVAQLFQILLKPFPDPKPLKL